MSSVSSKAATEAPPDEQGVAYLWLKERIASMPRDESAVLTEAEVMRAAGIGRTPAREALLRMETEGYLKILPRKGAFVPPVSDGDIVAVMEARALIEEWCIRRALEREVDLVSQLAPVLEEQARLLSQPRQFIEQDHRFHQLIVRAVGNLWLADFYEMLRERQLRMGLLAIATADRRARDVLQEHAAILTGLRQKDTLAAVTAITTHLSSTLAILQAPLPVRWDER
jgi:DNA-binding GntR family transcriptional regulator